MNGSMKSFQLCFIILDVSEKTIDYGGSSHKVDPTRVCHGLGRASSRWRNIPVSLWRFHRRRPVADSGEIH